MERTPSTSLVQQHGSQYLVCLAAVATRNLLVIHDPISKAILLVMILVAGMAPASVVAQFSYLGIDAEYTSMKIDGSSGNKTSHSQIRSNLSAVVRPFRHIGAGVAFSFPITTTSKFSFDKASTTGGNFNDWEFSYERSAAYKPNVYKYAFEQGSSVSLFVRIFLETRANVYIEGRGNFTSFDESFTLLRQYTPAVYWSVGDLRHPAVSAANFQYSVVHQMFVPSVRFGLSPHVGKNGFLNAYVGFDFFSFGGSSFSYSLSHEYDYSSIDQEYYVTMRGKLVGPKTAFMMGFGGGVFL